MAPKVSEHLPEIIGIVQKLIERGVAYESAGDVYFQVSRYPAYAKLSKRNLDDLRAGERVQPGSRSASPSTSPCGRRPSRESRLWDSPWGKGRPGWHIECSAMSRALPRRDASTSTAAAWT